MKIAIVNRHVEDVFGGSEMQCDNIAKALSQRGHQVSYIAPAGKADKNYNRTYQVVPVESHAKAIAQAVIGTNPDVVYWRLNKFFLHDSAKAIAKQNIPIVFSMSHISDTKPWTYLANPRKGLVQFLKAVKQGLTSAYNYRGYKYISGAACLNQNFMGLLPVEKQKYLPNSIDTTAIPFTWPRPFVLWVSNLKRQKQPEMYVKLAKALEHTGVDFLMIGSNQSRLEYDWIETENSRQPNFHYLGGKAFQEVNGALEQCLFNVHTCQPEGFCNIFLQAWFKHKPTVTLEFDPDGLIEKNKLGGNAKGDFTKFVSMVEELITNAEYRDLVGNRAYEFGTENFSLERTADAIEAFLIEVADSKKSPAESFAKELSIS